MKLMTVALGLGLIGASTAHASPLYVGKQIAPANNVTLGFQDTPTKKAKTGGITSTTSTGNIVALDLKGDYNPMNNLSVGLDLPFFTANKNATANTYGSRSSVGNIALNANWHKDLSLASDRYAWGYTAAMDAYFPTSRKNEATTVAFANPTTDIFLYHTKATTLAPSVGLYIENARFVGKTNVAYNYSYITGVSDKNRNNFSWQTAATWKATPWLNANLEYNTIILDSTTAKNTLKLTKYRQSLAPSVSGTYKIVQGSAFVNLPLDSATRDVQNVAFGMNVGYVF